MPIRTPRLLIKPREIGEGKALNQVILSSHEHLKRWMPWSLTAPTVEESELHCRESLANYILRKEFVFSIYDPRGTKLLGSTGFHLPNWKIPSFHTGYWIAQEHEGKGYVTEAVNALTRYAFEVLGAKRLEIRCDVGNDRSLAVAKRLGYRIEGTLAQDSLATDGSLRSTIIAARTDAVGLPDLSVKWGPGPQP